MAKNPCRGKNPPLPNDPIPQRTLIVGEGPGDCEFIYEFLRHREIGGCYVTHAINGKDAFGTRIRALATGATIKSVRSFVFVTDCDDGRDQAHEEVRTQLDDIEVDGRVLPVPGGKKKNETVEGDGLRTTIITIPIASDQGALEDMVLGALCDTFSDEAEEMQKCIDSAHERRAYPNATAKAKASLAYMVAVTCPANPITSIGGLVSGKHPDTKEILSSTQFDKLEEIIRGALV